MRKTPNDPMDFLSDEMERPEPRPARRTMAELRAAKAKPGGADPDIEEQPAVTPLARGPRADTVMRALPQTRDLAPPTRDAPPRRAEAETLRLPSRRGRLSLWFWTSLILLVALPTGLAAYYYLFVASDQYVSEFRFAVKSSTPIASSSSDLVGAALGQSSRMSAFSDNFIVADYVRSREAVSDLLKTIDLRTIYSNPVADDLARLNPEVPTEKLVSYWRSMIDASFDVSTGISVVRVRAFTPQDAQRIAQALIAGSEALVNRMAERARQDSIRFAEQDVKTAENRLREVTARLRQFRNTQQSPDLTTSAESTLGLTLQLRTNLAQMEAQLTSLSTRMAPEAPTIRVLKNNIAATREQLAKIEGELGAGAAQAAGKPGDEGYAATLSDYEDIRLELQFAQQSYQTMLTTLDQVRSAALSDRTYLMPYVQPALAESALYPERWEDVLIVFLIAGVAWAIVMLAVYAVRDHMI